MIVTQHQGEYLVSEDAGDRPAPGRAFVPAVGPEDLGDSDFKRRHGLRFAYVAGAMANGISSTALVKTMAENGMLGVFGAGGLGLDRIEAAG